MIKPKRRKPWRCVFEKVRILYKSPIVTISPTGGRFAVKYGPLPEHVVRVYPTVDQAITMGRKLAEKLGAKLCIEVEPGKPLVIRNPSKDDMFVVGSTGPFVKKPFNEYPPVLKFDLRFK